MWDTGASDLLVDALTNPLSLVLLVLLQDSQQRFDRAQDQRQDQIERSLWPWSCGTSLIAPQTDERPRLLDAAEHLEDNADMATSLSSAGLNDESLDSPHGMSD